MTTKRLGVLFVLSTLLVFPLSASMISFLIIETGLQPESSAGEYSTLWEDGLMGVFFDSGHIVSNGSVLRLEKKPVKDFPDEAQADFVEASEGGAEYLVIALLEYKNNNGKYKPAGVSLRVFSVSSKNLVYQQQFSAGTGADLREEYTRAQEAARAIITHLSLFQNSVSFGQAPGKTGQKPGFSVKSKEAVLKTEVLEQLHLKDR
jgi:hypothetical protein